MRSSREGKRLLHCGSGLTDGGLRGGGGEVAKERRRKGRRNGRWRSWNMNEGDEVTYDYPFYTFELDISASSELQPPFSYNGSSTHFSLTFLDCLFQETKQLAKSHCGLRKKLGSSGTFFGI
ncbi:hypothetical protein L6452_03474 [Arctium lappa]|uniref:Uncharacterized protein n=1 Tax=Arctium lappa TaxID=4217 RepID=A0ACB9FM90_ARCLA|nr:hypothetical protein L6452_03474 [Arctium lappa]